MADNTNTLTLTLQIKEDGSIVVDQVKKKFDDIEKTSVSGGQSITQVLGGIKAGWLAVTAAAGATYLALKEFLDAASEAEQIESRLAFQAGAVGYNFHEIKPYVDEFAESVMRATRFSDEMAREGLGQMLQYTSDVEQAMSGVRLAMDVATQTGQDLHSTTRLVGMAMNGNAEILGRWIPELRDLDSKLGSNATSAEKAAYAIKILNEKFGGAAEKDLNTYAGQVANLKNQFDEVKESIGKALLPLAQFTLTAAKSLLSVPSLFTTNIPSYSDIGAERQAKRKAQEQAAIAAAAKAYADDLANWKATQEQRQAMNFQFAMQEWQLKKNTMALIDAEEFVALEKAKKAGADLDQIRQVYHLKRLDQIKKEKEDEQNAMLSLATLWKGYYDERIGKENEIINLVKGMGIETTVGARLEFAGIEEQFKKISEMAGLFTSEEFEKIKAAYTEKVKGTSPFMGGDWEKQRQVETMQEQSLRRIEEMFKGAPTGKPETIIETFDQTRQKALELQQTIETIKNQKLQIDTSRLVDAMNQIDQFEDKLIALIQSNWNIQVGVEIVGDELLQKLESNLGERIINKRSSLGQIIQKNIEGVVYYSNE